MSRLPFPPFGKQLSKLRFTGARPPVVIHCGSMGWQRAREWIASGDQVFSHLCMPLDAEPAAFDWRICADCECAIIVCPSDNFVPWQMLDELATVVVLAGAIKVSLLNYLFMMKTFRPIGATT